ncbi:hypothetical protein LXG23DRAFT_34154 [Yarrowia lipolytica]|nr:hypothetical protein LXG23DRAFT_34154 [Yarrowia lipolytica]
MSNPYDLISKQDIVPMSQDKPNRWWYSYSVHSSHALMTDVEKRLFNVVVLAFAIMMALAVVAYIPKNTAFVVRRLAYLLTGNETQHISNLWKDMLKIQPLAYL